MLLASQTMPDLTSRVIRKRTFLLVRKIALMWFIRGRLSNGLFRPLPPQLLLAVLGATSRLLWLLWRC